MPVRGRGHYKRPYHITVFYADGSKKTKSFHWPGPYHEEAAWARRALAAGRFNIVDLKCWVTTNDEGRAIDYVARPA